MECTECNKQFDKLRDYHSFISFDLDAGINIHGDVELSSLEENLDEYNKQSVSHIPEREPRTYHETCRAPEGTLFTE